MTNNMYSVEEQRIIVNYLVDNNIAGNLQGNALWKRMEREGVLNRTWQSMRSHFKTAIINTLHLHSLSEYHRNMILHGFGRKARPNISQLAKPAPPKKPIPFSSDSDSDTTVCDAAQAKRPRRDSGSNASFDLLACNTTSDGRNNSDNNQPSTSTSGTKTNNHDIRSYMVSTVVDTDNHQPSTSTPKVKHHKTRKPKHNDIVIIIDSDDDDEPIKTEVCEQQIIVDNMENEAFSLEEDTQLIMFFKTHQCYLTDIRSNFTYVAFNYDTPTSLRTPNELRTRFVEHIMPKLYTYDCLTYEEMVTYYDRTDIDVPVELQQIISKTVAEQKKNKLAAATKVTVNVSTQAEPRSSVDKMISTDVPDVEMVSGDIMQGIVQEHHDHHTAVQDRPSLQDACVVQEPIIVDATTQIQQANVDNICNTTMVNVATQVQANVDKIYNTIMVDAATQVQPEREDKICNTDCQCQVNASTQTPQHKMCNTDVTVQHVEFINDNMLHVYLPNYDDRKPLHNLQNICDKYNKSQHNQHLARQKKCRVLNDKQYVDVTVDPSVRQIVIDKCEAELLRLTAETERLEGTLRKVRGYETAAAVSDNKENQAAESNNNLAIKNEHCAHVSEHSNNTTIISCTAESLSDCEADVSKADNGSQTDKQPELMFDIFQTELNKNHVSTQIGGSHSDSSRGEQQMDSSNNTTQDGGQTECSTVICIQPDIEFSTRQSHQPMQIEQTSDESSDDTEAPTANAACQIEPLNLSTNSHESEETENVNSEKFYSAVSQDYSQI